MERKSPIYPTLSDSAVIFRKRGNKASISKRESEDFPRINQSNSLTTDVPSWGFTVM